MDLSTGVTSSLIPHPDETGSDSFMLSVSIDDDDEIHAADIHRSEGAEAVLPHIEGVPYLLDTNCLITETTSLATQVDDVYHSAAISLHSYSQVLPNMASECLHNYSQPSCLPAVGANTKVLHNYSQPWPQSTDSFTSVHNYCIADQAADPSQDLPENEVKIYKLSRPDVDEQNDPSPVSLKLQLVDSFVCQWRNCDAAFMNTQQLVEHIGCHIKTQPAGLYQCFWMECPRKELQFECRYKLVQHMRIHTAERPHKCSRCQAEFSSAEGLTKHQRVHTGEKPYSCTEPGCTKAFKNSGDRYKHAQTHKTKYPYHCKFKGCGKMYTDPGTLRRHTRLKHPEAVPRPSGPVMEKRIRSATLLSNSGVETCLDISELAFTSVNGSLYCEDSTLLASAGIAPGTSHPTAAMLQQAPAETNGCVRTILNGSGAAVSAVEPASNQDTPLDLSNSIAVNYSEGGETRSPPSANWVTFNPLDDT